MMADVEKFHFRLVLLGSLGTGKTSILNRFLFKKFEPKYKPTVEDLFTQDFDLGCIEIKVDFLDTSGSMQFPAMRRLSITTGSAFLIVYAVDDESSYDVLKMCIAEIQEIRPDYQEIPIVFAGNKCDIPRERRTVLKEVVSNYVHYELPRLRAKVIECSCKSGINVDNIFKAYLSLAKVSLSAGLPGRARQPPGSPLPSSNGSSRTPSTPTLHEQPEIAGASCSSQPGGGGGSGSGSGSGLTSKVPSVHGRRPSSLKVVLGVRKSCDAAIISPMKSVLFVTTPLASLRLSGSPEPPKVPPGASDSPRKGAAAEVQNSPQRQQQQQQQQQALRRTAAGSHCQPAESGQRTTASQEQQHHQQQQRQRQRRAEEEEEEEREREREEETNRPGEMNLEAAIQSKLSLGTSAPKPRSRSLIWRPNRKSRTHQETNPDCRIS